MAFEDKPLTCRDCKSPFIFSAGEQGFYLEKGLLNEPQRCPTCRAGRRRELTTVTCAACGSETAIPFMPHLGRPVYCSSCLGKVRAQATA